MKRIKQISVKNLFGMFDHTIPLNLDEHITIIHGPNGFGKTSILRLLSGLFSQNHFALRSIPFDEFRVHFDDGTDFWVDKAEELHDEYEKGGRFPPSFQEVTFHFIDTVQGRLVTVPPSSFNVVLSSGRYGPRDANERAEISKNRELLRSMRQSVSLRLIETQRLQNTSSSSGKNNEGPFGRITELPDGDQEFEESSPVEATVASYSQELAGI